MSKDIEILRSFPEPRAKDLCDISADANHSRVIFEEIQGYETAIKLIDISDYDADHRELIDLCEAYRTSVTDVYYEAPRSHSTFVINGAILEIIEDTKPGETLEHMVCKGDRPDHWAKAAETFFLPLRNHFKREPIKIGPYVSNYPMDFLLDSKPANIVATPSMFNGQMTAVPIDFFPPLQRLWSNGRFIHASTEEEDNRIQYSYGDLEVLMAKFFFETRRINHDFAETVKDKLLHLCDQLDESGCLAEGMVKNVVNSHDECPHCSYCMTHA